MSLAPKNKENRQEFKKSGEDLFKFYSGGTVCFYLILFGWGVFGNDGFKKKLKKVKPYN